MRKLLVVALCGLVHRSACTRVRFEQPFHDPMYRQDPHLHGEPVFKREHFFPRDSIVQPEQILPQANLMRSEPFYASERILPRPPQQPSAYHNEDFLQNEQLMQGEPLLQSDPFIRSEAILRREPFIRREPLFRREAFLRGEPVLRRGRIYQNAPVLREGGMCRAEPAAYAVMMAQCQCQEPPRVDQAPPQDAFFPIPQSVQQQPLVSQLIIPKQAIKQQVYQPFLAFPRIQRFVRKSFKPVESFQFAGPPVQNAGDFNAFTNEPVPFPGNYQNQGSQPENTSEPSQNKPVTVRTVAQMPNALTLAQMSSIC